MGDRDKKPIIAVTMGDPAGIGPEIILKALNTTEVWEVCRPVVVGDMGVLERARRLMPLSTLIRLKGVEKPIAGDGDYIPVIDLVNVPVTQHRLGEPAAYAGRAAAEYIDRAASMALTGEVDAITTAPINKETLKMAGYGHPGHTEMLAELTSAKDYGMMLVGGGLRVMLVSIHVPLRDAPDLVTKESVLKAVRLAHRGLKSMGVDNPRIAVAGLNPHAGEAGMFGKEEKLHIAPAVAQAIEEGYDVTGPLPPDTVFYKAKNGVFDVVVCMYHDQGLIPLKLLAFGAAVNVTIGLPIIRTSVDHGTAYDIAGKGVADPASLVEALRLAAKMVRIRHRQFEKESSQPGP
jgi:4-hydroxythreonine-4-phosphate dehydrogenase